MEEGGETEGEGRETGSWEGEMMVVFSAAADGGGDHKLPLRGHSGHHTAVPEQRV